MGLSALGDLPRTRSVDAIRATVASVIFAVLILLGDAVFGALKQWGVYMVAGAAYWLVIFGVFRHAHRSRLEPRHAPPAT